MNNSNKTITPTIQNVTTYEAATHLLTDPKAKLTGTARRACQLARDGEPRAGWEADHSRASKRRIARLSRTFSGPTMPQAPKTGTEKLLGKLKKKSWLQLNAVITRGNRRADKALDRAEKIDAPKIKAAYLAAARAFRQTAGYAQNEAACRKSVVCA